MLKGTSYTWSSVSSFHAHITKQVELYRLEWSDVAGICDRASTFLRPPAISRTTSSPAPLTRAKLDSSQENRGCRQWNYTALAVVIRKKTLIISNTGVVSLHRTILCFIVRSAEILFRQRFDTVFPCHTLLPRNWPRTSQWNYGHSRCHAFITFSFTSSSSSELYYIGCHSPCSCFQSDQPNAFGERKLQFQQH